MLLFEFQMSNLSCDDQLLGELLGGRPWRSYAGLQTQRGASDRAPAQGPKPHASDVPLPAQGEAAPSPSTRRG